MAITGSLYGKGWEEHHCSQPAGITESDEVPFYTSQVVSESGAVLNSGYYEAENLL